MTAVQENIVPIICVGESLFGVLAQPAAGAPARTAVLVVVGGPQYRAGSHRQFVDLARTLAAAGHTVLRFDVRGMGDAAGAARSFEELDDDIAAALDALLSYPGSGTRAVLWGLCDGASAALLYMDRRRDARVAGMALLNPWIRSDATLARTQVRHYYARRLLQPGFWAKLLRGGIGGRAVGDLLRSLRLSVQRPAAPADAVVPFQHRMARQWRAFAGPVLLMLSGDDYTAREFEQALAGDPAWRGAWQRPGLQRVDLPGADHTLSAAGARRQCEAATLQWLQQLPRLPQLQRAGAAV